jgi:hypothetical protein
LNVNKLSLLRQVRDQIRLRADTGFTQFNPLEAISG